MDHTVIEHLIRKEDEGQYLSLPFDVPQGMESITISYHYPNKSALHNVIDLGLEDGDGRFLGWSGSARERITVGAYDATPGYLMEAAQPGKTGKWRILIGAYHVEAGGVKVRYEIQFHRRRAQWLFGDFHMHSDASDGQHDIATLAKMAKQKGLDFIAVTNHNNYAENLRLPHFPGITLVPGVEWTHYKGHMNFFGIGQPFRNSFVANTPEEMRRIVREAREDGAVISVNHPKCNFCPYLWGDEECFDMIEVWNGPMRPVNLRGIAWWTKMLQSGRKIAAVGGSDFHHDRRPARMANPVTAVYSASRSAADIVNAALHGHSYIVNCRNGVRLSLSCGGKSFGDTVAAGESHAVQFAADHAPKGTVLRLIGAQGELLRLKPQQGRLHGEATVRNTPFAYLIASVWLPGMGDYPLAVSNPIYFR